MTIQIKGGPDGASRLSLYAAELPGAEYHALYINIDNDGIEFQNGAAEAWIRRVEFELFQKELLGIRESFTGSVLLNVPFEATPHHETSIMVKVESWGTGQVGGRKTGVLAVSYEVVIGNRHQLDVEGKSVEKIMKEGVAGYFFIDGEFVDQYIESNED